MADNETAANPISTEDLLARFYAITQDPQKGDDWRVKVLRRETPNATAEAVAVFDDARLEHIANAEMWLAMICGGGPYYELRVWHAKTPMNIAGVLHLPKVNGPPRKIDPAVMRAPNWPGPKKLVYPTFEESDQVGGGGGATWGRAAAGTNGLPSAPASPADFLAELARREAAFEEKRHRAEVESIRREAAEATRRSEERLRELEARVLAAQKPAGPDLVQIISVLAPVLTPVITALMSKGEEARIEMLRLEQKRLETEAARAAADKSRPIIPPEVVSLMEKRNSDAAEQAKLFAAMAEAQNIQNRASQEAQGTLMRTTLQTVSMLMDTMGNRGEAPEEPWVKVATEGMRTVQELLAASTARNKLQAALPPSKPKPPAAPPAKPPPPARGNPKAVRPVPPPPPAQPSPLVQPADAVPPDAEPQRAVAGPPVTMDDVERMVRSEDPPAAVAEAFFRAIETDEASQAELQEAGGVIEVFEKRFDEKWVVAHGEYVQNLADALAAAGEARGINVAEEEQPAEEGPSDAA